MKSLQIFLAASSVLGLIGPASVAQPADLADGQGQMVGRLTGDATRAQYSDDYTGNIVGGGDRISQRLSGDATSAQYTNPHVRRAPGIPTFVGGREGDIVYVPHEN